MSEIVKNPEDTKLVYDLKIENGAVKVMPKLTAEDIEKLKALSTSSSWKLYRQILVATRDSHAQSLNFAEETNKAFKTIGTVAGLNLAVVQLDILVGKIKEAGQVPAVSKKQAEPVR